RLRQPGPIRRRRRRPRVRDSGHIRLLLHLSRDRRGPGDGRHDHRGGLRMRRWLVACLALLAACAAPMEGEPDPAAVGDPTTEAPAEWTGTIRHVPDDYPTIQAAVDGADPGDLVLIGPGVYREEVQVSVPGITLDRKSTRLNSSHVKI